MADYGKYYRAYMYMKDLLKSDFTYNYITAGLKDGDKGKDALIGKTNEKVIDMDWVVAIEEALPYIQKAIDEQRRFIKQIENVVRIELAKKVGPDSVKHLSQHTNLIAKVEDGMVTPNKLLVTEREESFAIYENRVLMTLIRKALLFVNDKYSKMKDVPNDSYNKISMTRHLVLNDEKVDFAISYTKESHETLADDLDVLDVSELSDFDRIRRIRSTLNEFLNTQLMKEIGKEPEVRPPITQTNLLKKNPNFKKAMELWVFLDSYKRDGFEVVGEEYEGKMSAEIQQDIYFAAGFEHFMMSIATNPGLRNLLHAKFEEENARIAEEESQPQKTREAVLKAHIDAVRKEEMEIRLREIREREKKILDLNNEIKSLKNLIDQKEQQIITLKGQVSALEDQLSELKEELKVVKLRLMEAEQEIERLKEENQQLKDKITQLENTITELNNTIDELNKHIDELNEQIRVLTEENVAMKAKIAEQEAVIEEQKAKIAELEIKVAEQLAQITALTENLRKTTAELEDKKQQVVSLTNENEMLNNTLQTERQQNKETINRMNSEFAEKTRKAEEAHKGEIKALQNTIDKAEADHAQKVAQMNAEFADKANAAEQRRINDLAASQKEHELQLEKVKKSHADASAAISAQHSAEINKIMAANSKELEAQRKSYEKQMTAVRKEKDQAYAVEERKFDAKLAKLKKQMQAEYNDKIKAIKAQSAHEVAVAKKKAKDQVKLAKLKARKKMFTPEELNEDVE